MRKIYLLLLTLFLLGCNDQSKKEKVEQKRKLYREKQVDGLNKSFEYETDKIATLQKIGKDTVANIYKEYLESYSHLKFASNSFKIIANDIPPTDKQPFKIDLVNAISGKYQYPKYTIYSVFKIIDNETGIDELNSIIDDLFDENIQLQQKLEKFEEN